MEPRNNSFLMNDVPKDVYHFLKENHKCVGCGRCCHCKPIVIMPQDIKRAACALGLSPRDFKKQYTMPYPGDARLSTFKQDSPCAFLDENNRCKIYAARPDVCKNYPLMKGARVPRECKTLLDLVKELVDENGQISNHSVINANKKRSMVEIPPRDQ
jgi:Fe-S-cluster containining protein